MEATLQKAAKILRGMAAALPKEIAKAEKASLNEARRIAIQLSSGPYSSVMLAAMGHPYSRRTPHPPRGRADIINVQTGLFRSSWTRRGPYSGVSTGEIVTALVNTAPYSYKMRGTYNMIARPIDVTIAKRMEPKRRARLETATNRALRVK